MNALGKSSISLHEAAVLCGKLMYFAQLGHPILIFVGEILAFMKAILDEHLSQDMRSRSRPQGSYEITPTVKYGLRTLASIIEMTRRKPLPLLDNGNIATSNSIVPYIDDSGHLADNPSLGIFVPKQNRSTPLVCSWLFPDSFCLELIKHRRKYFARLQVLNA